MAYMPNNGGQHEIHINYGGPINNSPFSVEVDLPLDASKVWAEGSGLSSASGLLTGQSGNFTVHTENAGKGQLIVNISDPHGRNSPANIVDNGDGTYTVEYLAELAGAYTIDISYGGMRVPNAPFKVEIKKAPDASLVKVYGPGVGISATNQVEENLAGVGLVATAKGAKGSPARPRQVEGTN